MSTISKATKAVSLARAEYNCPKGPPNTKSRRKNPQLWLRIPKRPCSELHGVTPQLKAISKTHSKTSTYQINGIIVLLAVIVFEV